MTIKKSFNKDASRHSRIASVMSFPVNKKSIVRAPRFSVSAVSTVIESIGRADCLVESISGLIFPCFSYRRLAV